MIGYVYLTANDLNDIKYIGKRQKPKFDKSYKGSGTVLKQAFKKYGKDKFYTTVLEWCETKEELCEAEKKWIAYYREHGQKLYNVADGGDGGNVVDWKSLSEERRKEINKKNSDSHKGEKNPFWGKKHSEETKRLIKENSKNDRFPIELMAYKEHQRSKLPKVAQLDKETGELIKVWDNWCDASKAVSPNNRCGYAHIGECCKHKKKSAYGFRWEYAEMGWTV